MPGDSVTIMATNVSVIDNISVNKGNAIENIYDIAGRRLPGKQHGVNIILYADGTRKKVIVK